MRSISLSHDRTDYVRTANGWLRVRRARSVSGVEGYSEKPVRLNTDMLLTQGSMKVSHVDWFYRFLMWMCQHTGIKRLVIWYRNLEDE